jgi:hypothetical protein
MVISDVNYQRGTSVSPALIVPEAVSAMLERVARALLIAAVLATVFLLPNRGAAKRYINLWCVFFLYSVYLAVKGLGASGLLSHRIFAELGPGAALIGGLMFVGASERFWPYVLKGLRYTAFAAAVLVCFEIARLGMASRAEAYARYFTYETMLEVSALLPAAHDAATRGRVRLVSWFPFLALGAAAVVMQTRLIFIVMAVSMGALFLLAGRQRHRIAGTLPIVLVMIGALLVPLLLTSDSGILSESGRQFWDRRGEDTRTRQATSFFNRVSVDDLVFGVGIPPEGAYTGEGDGGIDLGYINIAYFGGVPAVVLFVLLHLGAAVRCVKRKLNPVDAACVALVLAYGVRLFSSTVPNLRPQYIIVLLLAGRCVAIISARRRRLVIVPAHYGEPLP